MSGSKGWIAEAKGAYEKLNDQFWRAKCAYIRYYETLPLDAHTILLESEHGKKINGNIFYLVQYLSRDAQYRDYRIYVSSMGRYMRKFTKFLRDHGIKNVKITMLASDEYMRLLASAKYLINDTSFGHYFIKKEGQVYLNTWHGTPLKHMGRKDSSGFAEIGNIQKNFVSSDYILFPNEYMRRHMTEDYMLENICKSRILMGGYPRNEIFFDRKRRTAVREELGLAGKRVYAYLPTWRGGGQRARKAKNNTYLLYYLFEMDRRLGEDEVLYVNLHPLAKEGVDFKFYEHIRPFPERYETYELLNAADALITDYSSVFFDYVLTGNKIVLFPYDEEEYLSDRGMYLQLEELPFPRVYSVDGLFRELRSGKAYDESGFRASFCPYENELASKRLCDRVILGQDTGIAEARVPDNGKENVLIFAGNLSGNGITASLRNLLHVIDTSRRNYIITFIQEMVAPHPENLKTFPAEISYYATTGDLDLTVADRVIRKLFKKKTLKADCYVKLMEKRLQQDFQRRFGEIRVDHVIQFNGYDMEVILGLSVFPGNTAIFVHNDMLQEIATRGNQRRDVLAYAYRHYGRTAVVTEDILAPAQAIAGGKGNIRVVRNAIDWRSIDEKSRMEIALDPFTKTSVPQKEVFEVLRSPGKKFINIGRFSPEKGQERLIDAFYRLWKERPDIYLIIMGGNETKTYYAGLLRKISGYGLTNRVILLKRVSNPYPVLRACDYFVLSSFYEGFGLVIAEADILGKPVISTDIPGPRSFMQKNGGTLVENSEEGIFQGMRMLCEGKIRPMNADYEAYNREAGQEFEELFS